ncbi:MAG TPA: hypothetical protein ENK88_00605 [Campylobacterales bacterium]|nr:hypothetical protein [Campylobacterales bacterium]
MKRLISYLSLLAIITNYTNAFEQNGVKDGNTRVSVSLYSNQNKDEYNTINFNAQLAYFATNKIETLVGIDTITQQDNTYFTISPGVNYYFYNRPIITSYIGTQYYYLNSTNEYIKSKDGIKFYVGTHIFLSENVAVTPEFGSIYLNFDKNKGTYFNTFLSYFF